jgi:cell shape-determining protein MreC
MKEIDRLNTERDDALAENERLRAQIKGRTLVPELVEKDREVARLRAENERLRSELKLAHAETDKRSR